MKYIFKIRNLTTSTSIYEIEIEASGKSFNECKKEALDEAWKNGYREDGNHIMTYCFEKDSSNFRL